MIKFFRKIRRKLLSENKLSKYLLYAIGEIILVVIGILIALQINNWSERAKQKDMEIDVLHDFHESLVMDLENLENNMKVNEDIKKSLTLLIDYTAKELPYHDSLKFHFGNITTGTWQINLNETPFENLKANSIDLISNENLKEELMLIYGKLNLTINKHQEMYYNLIEYASLNIFNTRFEAFQVSNYETWKLTNNDFDGTDPNSVIYEMVPLDYEALRVDHEFLYFIKSLREHYNWLIEAQADSMKKALKDIIQKIETELKVQEN